jgi:chemotaxis protein histidine kinase CheA
VNLDPQLLRELHATFRAELDDQLRIVTAGLIALEASDAAGVERREVLNSVFRAAHNIKGAARSVDLRDISEIAHHLESLFAELRTHGTKPDAEVVDVSLGALDLMRDAMNAHDNGTPLAFDTEPLFARLEAVRTRIEPVAEGGEGSHAGRTRAARTPAPVPKAAGDCTGAAPQANSVAEPPIPGPVSSDGMRAVHASYDEHIRVSTEKLARVAGLAEELQIAKIGLDERLARAQELEVTVRDLATLWRGSRSALRGIEGVDLPARLRHVFDATSDLVAQVEEGVTGLIKGTRSSTSRVGVISKALQGDVRLLRLVPVATLLRPMVRSVREIGREQGKQVELRIAGDDIEMDRMVLNGVRDPLLHLLRNAIDHGLESPDERRRADKAEAGQIAVEVASEGGRVVVTVRDDGRGIDAAAIRRAAAQRQVAAANELARMSDADVLDLVFRPGFSTREVITNVSGRGIGLDVVRTNVQALKGTVELQSEPGRGTAFVLRLPITLSTERGLEVRVGPESLVIPSVAVERILDVAANAIERAQGEDVVVVEGKAVALRDLAPILGMERSSASTRERLSIVVSSRGSSRVAFLVDDVVGEREIVVKR